MSAATAARLLGVKRETLYAYASRGWLTRVPLREGRGSGYLRSDVERLKARSEARSGHGPVASAALRWGEPVLDSAITRIDPVGGPFYRGRSAVELAEADVPFEDVASLLWEVAPHAPWTSKKSATPCTLSEFARLVVGRGFGEATRPTASRETEVERAKELILTLAGGGRRGSGVAEAFLASCGAPRKRGSWRALNRALVLAADHELNASTFAARVAASAGADLFACVTAAVATLSGPQHGGESERLGAFVGEVGKAADARAAVARRRELGERIPGFGHPLYTRGDPRAKPLFDAARALSPARVRTLEAIARAVRDTSGLAPNLDAGLLAVALALGCPARAPVLFALGRCAGWVAHVLEQREAAFLLRPRARYTGR